MGLVASPHNGTTNFCPNKVLHIFPGKTYLKVYSRAISGTVKSKLFPRRLQSSISNQWKEDLLRPPVLSEIFVAPPPSQSLTPCCTIVRMVRRL